MAAKKKTKAPKAAKTKTAPVPPPKAPDPGKVETAASWKEAAKTVPIEADPDPAAPPAAEAPPAERPSQAEAATFERKGGEPRARFEELLAIAADVAERDAAGAELARLVDAREKLESDKREVLATFKERLSGIKTRSQEMRDIYKGTKMANVLCVEMLYVDTSTVDTVRQDTGEVIRTRAATREDLQKQIDDVIADNLADKTLESVFGPLNPPGQNGWTHPQAPADPAQPGPLPGEILDAEGVLAGNVPADTEPPPPLDPATAAPEDLAPTAGLTGEPPKPIDMLVRDNEDAASEGEPDDDQDPLDLPAPGDGV